MARIGQMAVGEVLGLPEAAARTKLLGEQVGLTKAQTGAIADAQTAFQQKAFLTVLQKAKTPEEVDLIKAQTEHLRTSGLLDEAQTKTINELLDGKKEAQRLGNEKAEKEIDSYLSLLLPQVGGGTVEAQIKAQDLIPLLAAQAKAGADTLAKQKFETQQEQTAVEVDKIIRTNPKSPEALARYEDFNRYSNRNQAAVNDGGKVKFVKLPKINGKLITARQVKAAADKLNMSVEEYLVNVLQLPEAIKMLK